MALKKTSISTVGLKELQARMKRLEVAVEPKDLNPILLAAVTLIRDRALENLRGLGLKTKTGNLMRAFMARNSKSSRVASAWTKAGTTGRQKNPVFSANHAHLIEYGHRIVGHKPKKKDTGKVTMKRPFFRPAVDAMRGQVRKVINEGIVKLLWDSEK